MYWMEINITWINRFVRLIILAMLLAACKKETSHVPISTPVETATICVESACTQNQSINAVPNGTPTMTSVTPCAEDEVFYPEKPIGLPGMLVYSLVQDTDTLHLIGGYPLLQYSLEITDHPFYPIGFSPSGTWLAYRSGSSGEVDQTIHLLANNGEVIKTTPSDFFSDKTDGYMGIWGNVLWINDQILLLYIAQPDPAYPDAPPQVIKALLDPFTGEWQQSYLDGLERKSTGTVVFAPDMTRVLFFSEAEGRLPEIRLEDVIQQDILWSQGDSMETLFSWENNWTGSAAWSPDSEWVAFTAVESRMDVNSPSGVGVYLVDREGKQGKTITNFSTRYGQPFTAGTLSWSPNGLYLAMSVNIVSSDPNSLSSLENRVYLYDLKNDDLVDLCWLRGIDSGYNSTMKSLVWSPDSRYLAYVASPSVSEDGQHVPRALILVDIYTGEVAELVENAVMLGGWSPHFLP